MMFSLSFMLEPLIS